jgi:hypothetical protein
VVCSSKVFFFNLHCGGGGGGIKVHATLRPPMAYCVSPGCLWSWRNWWNDWQGKPKCSEETCPSAVLSTTNPTCCPYANPGRHDGKPASNRWAAVRPSAKVCLDSIRIHSYNVILPIGQMILNKFRDCSTFKFLKFLHFFCGPEV